MQDLYKAIDALNEITQQERDAMRAAAKADVAAVRQATTGKAPPPTKARAPSVNTEPIFSRFTPPSASM